MQWSTLLPQAMVESCCLNSEIAKTQTSFAPKRVQRIGTLARHTPKICSLGSWMRTGREYDQQVIKGPDNPTCVFFRKSVAVDTIGSLSKGTSECASVSQ